MSRPLSRRSGAVDPFIVMDVMAAAAEKEAAGETVIHLEVGQPSTPAPKSALAAAHAALDSDRIGYVAALGMPALRERIARHYLESYGVEVSPERVVVTTGSSGGFPLAFLASFDAGDRVALAAPGYPAYRNILAALKAHGGQGGYVNAIACPDGIRGGGASCNSGTDPAGSGLALNATPR